MNSCYGIFLELMNSQNRSLLISFERYRRELSKKYEKNDTYYYVGTAALSLAASYCMINKDYSKFIEMAIDIVKNVDTDKVTKYALVSFNIEFEMLPDSLHPQNKPSENKSTRYDAQYAMLNELRSAI